jgi:putative endonuclease
MNKRGYFVYILSSNSGTLYTGVTNDIQRRMHEHRFGAGSTFTQKYKTYRLVYYEEFKYVNDAIAREKQIKGWLREKKRALIKEFNPTWTDLASDWFSED